MKWQVIEQHCFPEEYRHLADSLAEKNMFLSHQWFSVLLNSVVEPCDQIYWISVKDCNNNPCLLLPLWKKTYQPKWKNTLNSLSNYYTTLYEPLNLIEDKSQLKEAVETAVSAACSLDWSMIEISPLDPNGSCYDFLVAAFRKHKKHVSPYFLYGNWFLEVYQYNYQNYLESRPSQLRNTLKRKANKLKNNDLKYCVYKTPDEVNTNLESFIDLYNNSWKKPEPYPYFIPDLVNKFSKEGWVKLGMIYINSEIAASQLWFIIRNTAYIYKICQNPKFDSCSPGSLLTAYLIEHTLIHDKVIKVDFLTGDEPFKKNWMSHRNERWGLQIANPKTVIGLYHTNINIIIEIIKYLNKLFKIKTYEK